MSVSIVDIDDQRQKLIMKYSNNNLQIKKIQDILSKLNDKTIKKQAQIQQLTEDIIRMNIEYKNICEMCHISLHMTS